jgi:hypothetical protein
MKEIPNKITSLPPEIHPWKNGNPPTFADLLTTACDFTPTTGFDPATLRARARIDRALEGIKPGDIIKLEDADFVTAQQAISAVRWIKRHSEYIAFADAFSV